MESKVSSGHEELMEICCELLKDMEPDGYSAVLHRLQQRLFSLGYRCQRHAWISIIQDPPAATPITQMAHLDLLVVHPRMIIQIRDDSPLNPSHCRLMQSLMRLSQTHFGLIIVLSACGIQTQFVSEKFKRNDK